MENTKQLSTAPMVSAMLKNDTLVIETGGSIRRIKLDDFISSINQGNELLLSSVAWGVPIKQSVQTSPEWGFRGNRDMWAQFKASCGRYLVTNAGKAAKLAAADSSVYADGTPLDESKGHVMWMCPRLYYLVKEDPVTGIPVLWMSQIPLGGHFIEATCLGAYKASMAGSAITSRSGQTIAGSRSINSFWQAAQLNGKQWGLENFDHRKLMVMLLLSEYGNTNCQAVLGKGVTGDGGDLWGEASALPTGATKSSGDGFASIPITLAGGTDCCHVSLMGIEDPYGWQWEMTQGIFCGKSENAPAQDGTEVFLYAGNRMPSAAELASHPSGDYRQLVRPSSEGYVKEIHAEDFFDVFPRKVGGGSTSYWCDYCYVNLAAGQLVLWGGLAYSGARAGLVFAASDYSWAYAGSYVGSRLAYYGKTDIVSGAELVASLM